MYFGVYIDRCSRQKPTSDSILPGVESGNEKDMNWTAEDVLEIL